MTRNRYVRRPTSFEKRKTTVLDTPRAELRIEGLGTNVLQITD